MFILPLFLDTSMLVLYNKTFLIFIINKEGKMKKPRQKKTQQIFPLNWHRKMSQLILVGIDFA